MGRLNAIVAGDGAARIDYRYDKGGNRVAEATTPARAALNTSTPNAAPAERAYRYAPGTNRLLAVARAATPTPASDAEAATRDVSLHMSAGPKNPAEAAQLLRAAWFYHPTGVQLAQLRWPDNGGAAASRRIVYNSAKRPIAVYNDDRLVASAKMIHWTWSTQVHARGIEAGPAFCGTKIGRLPTRVPAPARWHIEQHRPRLLNTVLPSWDIDIIFRRLAAAVDQQRFF